jgi:hypothetical protein
VTRRRFAWALRLHPKSWRQRYGTEIADLVDELVETQEATPWGAAVGLAASGGRERARQLRRPRSAAGALVLTVVLVLVIYAATTVTGPTRRPTFRAVNLQHVKGFLRVCERSCNKVGYAPKRDIFVGLVAPVYKADHETLVGHEYPVVGFVPLGISPWSEPCTAANCRGTVVVPDVAGMFTPTAMAKLSGLGIATALYRVHSSTVLSGHVVFTSPPAGTVVHHDEPVVVDISVPSGSPTGWD